jgi:tRNA 2-thiouridine synthesizing protein A
VGLENAWIRRTDARMRRLDASGLNCPLPVLKARKALLSMASGERLEVITTDPMSVVDMPVFCAQAGHRIVVEEKRNHHFVFVIESAG